MAEGLLFSVAEGILEKLGSFALQGIGLWWGVKDEIELLRLTVLGVKVVLRDAEDRQARGDDPVRDWLGELKGVMDDAEDLVDDFSTEVLRRQVTNEVGLFFSSSNRLAYGLKMGHKIKAIRKRLDAVMSVGTRFNFQQRPVDSSTFVMAKKRDTHSSLPNLVVGRDDEKKAIKERLLSDNYETDVTVISIVGIGGMGKTTLAQLTYNDEDVKSRFDLKLWVCVSEDFNVKLIIEKILQSLNKSMPNITEMEPLKESLHEKISGKKYLLVLDDIWNEDSQEWCSLRDLLMGGLKGSRILITTRSKKVAEIASPLPKARYEVRGLSDKESWSLFAQMAFKQVTEPTPSHEEIGKEIVAKCKGVPLAITAIGRVMYFKETIVEWEPFRSKELVTINQGETSIMAALKLSYDVLPSHLKHCFAYCRLFPKDYKINVDTLIDLWTAQGFIKSSDPTQCLEDSGWECFKDLLWRSFFQDVSKDEFGNIECCKMHDLMHDLASSVAGAGSVFMSISNSREVSEKTQHLSVDCSTRIRRDGDNWQVPESVLEARRLRTFLAAKPRYYGVGDYLKIGEGQCHAIFRNLRRLRQLDLGAKTVPNSIGKLKQLRYFDLSSNREIKMLPRSITRLQNLQVLKLKRCGELRQLPKDIKKLVSLKKLDISGCYKLTHMPRGIGQLTSLERLTRFVLPTSENSNRKSGGLGELRDLHKLGGYLAIENLPHRGNGKGNQKGTTPPTGVAETCAAANLSEKPRLQKLELYWAPLDGDDDTDFNEDDVSLEALRPHPNLKSLFVENYGGINFASWLSSLTNLVQLELLDCPKCRSLPALDQLSLLYQIIIDGLTDLEYIDISICSVVGGGTDICSSSSNNNSMISFPSLEFLRLYECPNLKGWRPSSPSSLLPQFQRLSQLDISSCPNLTSMPPLSPSLKRLGISSVSFKSLEQMLKETISPAHEPSSSSLPSNLSSSLKMLNIGNIEHLPEDFLPVELLQTLTSLEKLSIGSCPTLTCLPHSKMLLLTSLKSLYIWDCENLELSDYDDDSNSNSNNNDAILCQGQGLRSLTSLSIYKIPKLVHLPRRLLLHSIALWRLSIEDCPNLASLPEWMPNLTSIRYLSIARCSQLSERCKNNMVEDWPKIAHIPNITVDGRQIQRDGCYKL